jgi:1-hydroxycarotenoid 3,4-desaturase
MTVRAAGRAEKVAIVGAGIGGLAAAIDLARQGFDVAVFERAQRPGGKMRQIDVGGALVDAGPTVLTMRDVFESLFADAGASLDAFVTLRGLNTLARHAWAGGGRLDLFADSARTEQAIGEFAGASDAAGYRRFCADSRKTFETLEHSFIRAPRPSAAGLVMRGGLHGLADLWRIRPYGNLWSELGGYFSDARLRQLFARYATYCGSSPFLAPATLMLIAHVEQAGVWSVEGGMQRIALAMEALALRLGVTFRYGAPVREILTDRSAATGVVLADGERVEADAVVLNADVEALRAGLFGGSAASVAPPPAPRSLSALTWSLHAKTDGFPLARHNVFFATDYAAEFADIFDRATLPAAPTVYVCAQDRFDGVDDAPQDRERILCLVNAPAVGDRERPNSQEIEACEANVLAMLTRCGLSIDPTMRATTRTGPQDFEAMFPATGGALYGAASHGWRASFARPNSRTRIPGFYLAGGSAHPGAGVPMAALSGRLAAAAVVQDATSTSASTGRWRRAAMPGGMSMRSATTDTPR